jgi:hypothetical protein
MAALTERQVKEMDIDWYCLVKGVPTHIASMGGTIPSKFRDRVKLRRHQDLVAHLIPSAEFSLNVELIESLTANGYEYLDNQMIRNAIEEANRHHLGFELLKNQPLPIRLFASTFVEKARRGFRSFARREDAEENEYVLIAEPTIPIKIDFGEHALEMLECEVRNEGMTIVI